MFSFCGFVLSSALIFGGGTHGGFYADVCLELLAIPLLAAALWPAFSAEDPGRRPARAALAVTLIAAMAVVIEIIPLPFRYWREGGNILSSPLIPPSLALPAFSTLSLTPEASFAAGTSLLVPLAIFAATLQLGPHQRRSLSFLVLGIGAVSLVLGFLQVLQGETSALRFYEITNPSEAVGFFANRNHFAALLNVTLVLAAYWLFSVSGKAEAGRLFYSRSFPALAVAASFFVAVLSGLAMSRSRAGGVLALAALTGCLLMIFKTGADAGRVSRKASWQGRSALLVSLFALIFTAEFGLGGLLLRFETDQLADLRIALNRTALEALPGLLPFGTGLGSFPELYAAVEKPENAFAGFANRAHNDLAEILLETGLVGGVLLFCFCIWFLRQSYRAWARPPAGRDPESFVLLRASSLILGLLLLHSLVDYPLRTAALGAVFAFFAAILASPPAILRLREQPRAERPSTRAHQPLQAKPWQAPSGWPEDWRN